MRLARFESDSEMRELKHSAAHLQSLVGDLDERIGF